MSIIEGFDRALVFMGLGDKVDKDQWSQMVNNTKEHGCDTANEYERACRVAETSYVKENIANYKTFKSGKPIVGEYLTPSYKQYKSRITTALRQGIPLFDENDVPVSSSSIQKAIKASKITAAVPKVPKLVVTRVMGTTSYVYQAMVTGTDGKLSGGIHHADNMVNVLALADEAWIEACVAQDNKE